MNGAAVASRPDAWGLGAYDKRERHSRQPLQQVPLTPPYRVAVINRTVLLTGASGLLGTWLRRTAPAGTTVIPLTHRTPLVDVVGVVADLRDHPSASAVVATACPAVVIHAAYAHDEASIVDATQNVVDAALAVGAGMVHVSTDAVFSGDGLPRGEKARPDAVWDYGRFKARAEQAVTRGSAASAIVRLPLVVSLDPEDHVVALIRRGAANRQPTPWSDDEFRQPASAEELAGAVWKIASLDAAQRAGTWHLPGPESLSRYEIAQRVVSALRLRSDAITAGDTRRSAERPRDIHLRDDRARKTIGWAPSPILSRELNSLPSAC